MSCGWEVLFFFFVNCGWEVQKWKKASIILYDLLSDFHPPIIIMNLDLISTTDLSSVSYTYTRLAEIFLYFTWRTFLCLSLAHLESSSNISFIVTEKTPKVSSSGLCIHLLWILSFQLFNHGYGSFEESSRCSSPLYLAFHLLNLKGLQLFLRFEVSQNRPEARACRSQSSNSSSSSSIISTSKSHGNLLEFDLCVVFSNPTMFTWKLGLCVFGQHAIPYSVKIKKEHVHVISIIFTYK